MKKVYINVLDNFFYSVKWAKGVGCLQFNWMDNVKRFILHMAFLRLIFTYFWSILIETPSRLLQSCRLLIRQQLARHPADKIPFLPLPRSLKDYLNYYH